MRTLLQKSKDAFLYRSNLAGGKTKLTTPKLATYSRFEIIENLRVHSTDKALNIVSTYVDASNDNNPCIFWDSERCM